MQQLNLPQYAFKIKKVDGERKQIFDIVRKKFVALQPEEWVRQNFIHYLIHDRGFAATLMSVEHSLNYNGRSKRGDIVVFNNIGNPRLIVECKAPDVAITQDVFDQAARYNMVLKLDYLIVTNGINHFCCKIDHSNNSYAFLSEIPIANEL